MPVDQWGGGHTMNCHHTTHMSVRLPWSVDKRRFDSTITIGHSGVELSAFTGAATKSGMRVLNVPKVSAGGATAPVGASWMYRTCTGAPRCTPLLQHECQSCKSGVTSHRDRESVRATHQLTSKPSHKLINMRENTISCICSLCFSGSTVRLRARNPPKVHSC